MDIFRHIISFMEFKDIPVVSREFLKTYIYKKWYRLDGIPLLVDIIWHAPGFCNRYCVCHVATLSDRMFYYKRKNKHVAFK